MAHRNIPEFPLIAGLWHQPGADVSQPPDCLCACQLCVKSWTRQVGGTATVNQQNIIRFIYLDARHDIRPTWSQFGSDILEIPVGSGRYYGVIDVEDVARGLPNEFRIATLTVTQHPNGGPLFWPIPIP